MLKHREEEKHEDECDHPGQESGQDRFAVKLADDAFPLGADDLAQPDLLGPVGRAGRGQVHEVDAGDEQDEQGDEPKV